MNTKQFYFDGIWKKIESHPKYNLGKRELNALIRFLPTVRRTIPQPVNILHLGVATGREVPYLIRYCIVKNYLLNDICKPVLQKTFSSLQSLFPSIQFQRKMGDVEVVGIIRTLRRSLYGPTLIVLVANGVIFSKKVIDKNIHTAMDNEDYFLLTLETPHAGMYNSYLIPPVLQLLSKSRMNITQGNVQCNYDKENALMNMKRNETTLLTSYKPTVKQLRARMALSGFHEIALARYSSLHITASLWKKK
ncbi:MAG: L-histidine N(alpha)-methyltransferase [Patescibacteria group bacterium]